jgi:hypothetical protein
MDGIMYQKYRLDCPGICMNFEVLMMVRLKLDMISEIMEGKDFKLDRSMVNLFLFQSFPKGNITSTKESGESFSDGESRLGSLRLRKIIIMSSRRRDIMLVN